MIISSVFSQHNPRLTVARLFVAAGVLLLLAALLRVQVLHTEVYGERLETQSLRRIRLPSVRGEIVDRHGVVLANNRPSYDVVLYLEQLTRGSKQRDVVRLAGASLRALSSALGRPVTLTEADVRTHYARRRPIPLPVWSDLSPALVAAFAERSSKLPGADILVTPVRQYPQGALAAHLLGYVGRAVPEPETELERYYYYQPDTEGRQGVERAYDDDLRGAPGGRTIRVNPGGSLVGELGVKPAERGHRLVLTIDARVQQIVEQALLATVLPAGRQLRGAAVALDPQTGEVLALASVPAFDPNLFNPGAPAGAVSALLTDPASPMLNRATGARYAPGSTFKPITLLAGLAGGTVHAGDSEDCRGALRIGNWPRPFGCWERGGHGPVDAARAMMVSCDVWFYQAGLRTGVDRLTSMAAAFGLGQPTGIDLGRDLAGLVPTPAWKRRQTGENWFDGNTAQLAIGQSYLLATPLQMAAVAATLANGGTILQPFVVRRIESADGALLQETGPRRRGQVPATAAHLEFVRQTMLGAVQDPAGTAHRALVPGLSVAGKTGTAEVDTREGRINRAWFIGFAPYDKPALALALVIEDAQSGGHTAGPVAGRILAQAFGKQPTAPVATVRDGD